MFSPNINPIANIEFMRILNELAKSFQSNDNASTTPHDTETVMYQKDTGEIRLANNTTCSEYMTALCHTDVTAKLTSNKTITIQSDDKHIDIIVDEHGWRYAQRKKAKHERM